MKINVIIKNADQAVKLKITGKAFWTAVGESRLPGMRTSLPNCS